MKKLIYLIVAIMMIACSKEQRKCIEITDMTGNVIKTCCASYNIQKRLCKCENEYLLEELGYSKTSIRKILKTSCD